MKRVVIIVLNGRVLDASALLGKQNVEETIGQEIPAVTDLVTRASLG